MRTIQILSLVFLCAFYGAYDLIGQQAERLLPNEITNRPLGLLSDASAVGWNPSLLGMTTELDFVVGMKYRTSFSFDDARYGAFAKVWHLGVGTTGGTDSLTPQWFYAGGGFPLSIVENVPIALGASLAIPESGGLFDDGDLSLGLTVQPDQKILAGVTVHDILSNLGDPRLSLNAHATPLEWLMLRGGLYYDAADTVLNSSAWRPEVGLDMRLFQENVFLSGTFNIRDEVIRLGAEFVIGKLLTAGSFNSLANEDGLDFDQGVGILRFKFAPSTDSPGTPTPPSTTRLGWAPDRAYTPIGLSYRYRGIKDASEDPNALKRPCGVINSGFDTPEDLVQQVKGGRGSYAKLAQRLSVLSPDEDELYKAIRRKYYSRPVRSSELMSNDSLTILSRQGYSIGIQDVDNSDFPLVSVFMQVTDEEGGNVRGLQKGDFSFADPSLSIVSVSPIDATQTIPVDVTLLIDCSGSMGDEIEAVRENAQLFVDKMEASGADYRIGGVLYGSIIYDTLHPTKDFSKFRKFASKAAAIGGDEISTLAIKAATEMSYRPDAQRIFVLITDDWVVQENAILTEPDLVNMLWDTKAHLYTINNSCKNNSAVTTRLTLGKEYDITAPFSSILDEIGTDITTTYRLVYESKLEEIPLVTILRGTVRDETGKPAGVMLKLNQANQSSSSKSVGTSGTSGEYEVEITEGLLYQASIEDANYLPLSEEVDLTTAQKGDTIVRDFVLKIPETVLYGQILDDKGNGVPGVVHIDDGITLDRVKEVRTDLEGKYRTPIQEGRQYRLTPSVPEYIPTPAELDTRNTPKGSTLEKNLYVLSIDEAIATGATFRLDNIFFDFDKSDLKPESIPELSKLIGLLNDYPIINVEIGAHTDSQGSDSYNQALSDRRAQSVVNYLIAQGINAARLVSKGYGETIPVASNETDEGRARNRRVEFKLIK